MLGIPPSLNCRKCGPGDNSCKFSFSICYLVVVLFCKFSLTPSTKSFIHGILLNPANKRQGGGGYLNMRIWALVQDPLTFSKPVWKPQLSATLEQNASLHPVKFPWLWYPPSQCRWLWASHSLNLRLLLCHRIEAMLLPNPTEFWGPLRSSEMFWTLKAKMQNIIHLRFLSQSFYFGERTCLKWGLKCSC